MDGSNPSNTQERRLIAALLSDRALSLELDDQGLEDLMDAVHQTSERLHAAEAAAKERAVSNGSAPGLPATVAIGLRVAR